MTVYYLLNGDRYTKLATSRKIWRGGGDWEIPRDYSWAIKFWITQQEWAQLIAWQPDRRIYEINYKEYLQVMDFHNKHVLASKWWVEWPDTIGRIIWRDMSCPAQSP